MRMWAIRDKKTKAPIQPDGEYIQDYEWIVTVQQSDVYSTKKTAKNWLKMVCMHTNRFEVAELIWKDKEDK